MNSKDSIEIRLLTLDDLEDWLEQCEILDSESGVNDIYLTIPKSTHHPTKQKTPRMW